MAILDLKEKLEPYKKKATGYIKQMLSSKHVVMEDGTDLETKVSAINSDLTEVKKIRYKTYKVTKNFVAGVNTVMSIGSNKVGDKEVPKRIVSISGVLKYKNNYHCIPVSPVGGSGTYLAEMLAQLLVVSSDGLTGNIVLWLNTAWANSTLTVTIGYNTSNVINLKN